MKHLFKTSIPLASALVLLLSSCLSENIYPDTPDVPEYKTISLHITQQPTTRVSNDCEEVIDTETRSLSEAETRGISRPIPGGELLEFNRGDLYLVSEQGIILDHFRLVRNEATNWNARIINIDTEMGNFGGRPPNPDPTIRTETLIIPGAPGHTRRVYIIGNTPYNDMQGNINIVGSRMINIIEQHNAWNVNLFGKTTTLTQQGSSDTWEGNLHLAPTVARLEIASITGTGSIADFNVVGIFVDNFFSRAHINGEIDHTSLWTGGTNPNAFYLGQGFFTAASNRALFDWGADAFVQNGLVVTPPQTPDFPNNNLVNGRWTYQVFAPQDRTDLNADEQPRIIIRLRNIALTDGTSIDGDRFVTVRNFFVGNTAFEGIEAGTVYRLAITFDEIDLGETPNVLPFLHVNPLGKVFAQAGGTHGTPITVTTNVRAWVITSYPTWLSFSVPTNTAQSGNSFTVTATQNGANVRNGTITVATVCGSVTEEIFVTQIGNNATQTVMGAGVFVGAFWRNNQRGERLIRIPFTGGDWKAVATEDWIQLDRGVEGNMMTWDMPNVVPGNPEDYRLPASAGGQVSGSGNIYFRIGLDSYNTNHVNPRNRTPQNTNGREPRWGQVLLVHSGGTHIIWIRQGEDTAELMRVGDAGNANTLRTAENAHRIRTFSPFNLTAEQLNVQVGTKAEQIAGTATNRSIFVTYPTQTGAFWQWGGNSANTQRMPWHPVTPPGPPSGGPPDGWIDTHIVGNWYTDATTPNLATNHETCPPGFRRPRDGDPWGNTLLNNTAALVQQSEMRQSLFLQPQIDTESNLANSVWGFYADGFFDRRLPTTATGGTANRATANTVAHGTTQIAHRGTLFFNAESGASLFLPATGVRAATGAVLFVGNWGFYWSSTQGYDTTHLTQGYDTSHAQILQLGSSITQLLSGFRAAGRSIRCVAE